jgi:DHA1 family multidrug resistance protein-like MFS transporter
VAAPSAAVFASTFALAALESYYPLYAKSIGYSESSIGIALAMRALLWTLSMPLLGRVSDRIGRTVPMLSGLALYAVASALIPLVGGYGSFLLISLLGFGEGIMSPASMAGIAENVDAKHRGAAMGIFGTMLMGGRAAGLLTMGVASALFGLVSVFYMSAAIAFICVMVVLVGSPLRRQ